MIRTSNNKAASKTKVVSRAARSRVKAASSRAGRTSPASKVASSADPKSKARQMPGLFLLKIFLRTQAASASWLTTLSAISVSVASVFFSSVRVWSSNATASLNPSSLAQVLRVP